MYSFIKGHHEEYKNRRGSAENALTAGRTFHLRGQGFEKYDMTLHSLGIVETTKSGELGQFFSWSLRKDE